MNALVAQHVGRIGGDLQLLIDTYADGTVTASTRHLGDGGWGPAVELDAQDVAGYAS